MSIIIRLQNLPWAANSVDIRRYFAGLSIPEGGVHIVGGEKGDAFIAFSTDEDARLAMEKDGGKIKEMKIKLLLSSRSEMMRVIEQARNQNLALQNSSAIKAAVNDSDRRKMRERSPSPRRKEREKSPGRDRRRSSSRRDRSRSRSRSPSRRSRDGERRTDRSRREEKRFDEPQRTNDRFKNSREFSPKESEKEKSYAQQISQNMTMSQYFDPRMGATPQSFDSRQLEGSRTTMQYDSRQATIPNNNMPYFDSRNSSPYNSLINSNPSGSQLKTTNEPLRPPQFSTGIGSFSASFDKRLPSNEYGAGSSSNYETKRPSPTPATLAPNVGPNTQFAKAFGLPTHAETYDKMSSIQMSAHETVYSKTQMFASHPEATTYSTAQTAERGTIPAIPHDHNSIASNQPLVSTPPYGQKAVYGAEPHIRYEQIPEANQANRSATPLGSRSADQMPEVSFYGKRLPPNIPTASTSIAASVSVPTSSTTTIANKGQRRSRFEPEQPSHEGPFYAATSVQSDVKSSPISYNRPPEKDIPSKEHFNKPVNTASSEHKEIKNFPNRELIAASNEETWPRQPPHTEKNTSWNDGRQGLLVPPKPLPNKSSDFSQTTPMDIDEANLPQASIAPSTRNMTGGTINSNYQAELQHNRRPHLHENVPNSFEKSQQKLNREPLITEPKNAGSGPVPFPKRNEPLNRGPRMPPSLTVEVRGLPFDACDADILELFRGLYIPPENIKIQRNNRGQPLGNAFVKFINLRDFEEGLKRHKKFIGNSSPEVFACPPAIFENAPCSGPPIKQENMPSRPPRPQPREEDLCVELRGLPFSCKEEDVVNFFDGLSILDILIEQGPDGRASGVGFVEFGSVTDFNAALSMNGKMIGHRYIEVLVASKEIMSIAQGHVSDQNPKMPLFPQGPPREPMNPVPHPPKGPRPVPPDAPSFCIAINGVPKVVKNRDIADFFAEVNIIPRAIHIMLDNNKLPSGEAFAEFNSPRECDIALQQSGKYLAGVPLTISPITYWKMTDILGGPPPGPRPGAQPPSAPLLRNPSDNERPPPPPRRPLMPKPPPVIEDGPNKDGLPPNNMPPERFGLGRGLLDPKFPSDAPRFDNPEPPIGARPPFNRMRAPVRGGMRPPRPFGPNMPPPPRGPMPFRMRHPPPPPPPNAGSSHNDRIPGEFDVPGCVVAISNLHFRAGLEELLRFFHKFSVAKDNILRRYDKNGRATGEARVKFRSHEDALQAVKELNGTHILDRPVCLSLI